MFEQITPVILTYNEAPNIARTLEQLRWARNIVVVDSGSSDDTIEITRRYANVRVVHRNFDSFASQCNYGLMQVQTKWVLSLDADYFLTDDLVSEIQHLHPDDSISAYFVKFIYCINGKRLRGAAYPPRRVLYRRERAVYANDGHAHRVRVTGDTGWLSSSILHDDRKSLSHWLRAQDGYMRIEAKKLSESEWKDLGWADRLRKLRVVAPFAILFYCLFVKGAILDGRAGLYYTFQRSLAELILSLYLIEKELRISNCELRIANLDSKSDTRMNTEGISNCELRIANLDSKSDARMNTEGISNSELRIANLDSKSDARMNTEGISNCELRIANLDSKSDTRMNRNSTE